MFCVLLVPGIINGSITQKTPNVWEVLRQEFTLSHELNRPEVQEQIRWLVRHPGYIKKVSKQSAPYIYHVLQEIKKRQLPGELALIPMVESAYDPFVHSGAGAAGLWQLMPNTGSELGLKQDWWFDGRRSIRPSTEAALGYLSYLNKFFKGHWILALAAYDSGEGTIARAVKAAALPKDKAIDFWNLPLSKETKLYVPRLLALAEIIKNPNRYKVTLPNIPYAPYFAEVNIGSQIDLNHAAKLAGISYKELKKLNPGYTRWTTAPYKPFKLLVPKECVARFNLNLSNIPVDKRVSWPKHKVQKGDSLASIADRYNTTVTLIKQLNQLTSNKVTVNQAIAIPTNASLAGFVQKEIALSPDAKKLSSTTKNQRAHSVRPKDVHQLVVLKKRKQRYLYEVKSGDCLSIIARKHHTKVTRLLKINPNLHKNKTLKLGQKIRIG
nr:LysM peptidoglycan-binding domain-containing protein [Legionella worsleiensis]